MQEDEVNPKEQYANWKAPETVESIQEGTAGKPILSEAERKGWFASLQTRGYSDKTRLIKFMAKEKGVPTDSLLREVREIAKSQIVHPEKVNHFHRTSIDKFKKIINERALLSRAEIKKRHPDIEMSSWSASDSVMLTRDRYSADGKLSRSGLEPFDPKSDDPGSEKGVVFVFSPELIKQESYDAISNYPTVDNAPVDSTVELVLVDERKDVGEVERTLIENGLAIPVRLRNEWLKQRDERQA